MEELIQHFELPTYFVVLLLDQMREALFTSSADTVRTAPAPYPARFLNSYWSEKAEEYHRYAWTAPLCPQRVGRKYGTVPSDTTL